MSRRKPRATKAVPGTHGDGDGHKDLHLQYERLKAWAEDVLAHIDEVKSGFGDLIDDYPGNSDQS